MLGCWGLKEGHISCGGLEIEMELWCGSYGEGRAV